MSYECCTFFTIVLRMSYVFLRFRTYYVRTIYESLRHGTYVGTYGGLGTYRVRTTRGPPRKLQGTYGPRTSKCPFVPMSYAVRTQYVPPTCVVRTYGRHKNFMHIITVYTQFIADPSV